MNSAPLILICMVAGHVTQPAQDLLPKSKQSAPALKTVRLDPEHRHLTHSVRVVPETYFIPDTGRRRGAIRIEGDGITVDFNGAELVGSDQDVPPNRFTGVGVWISGRDITVRGLRVRGFKTGIYAVEADGLKLDRCDVSDNFRQRLWSTPQAESHADWLRPHDNDEGEWRSTYGAGVYVERSNRAVLRMIKARRGQNGIVLDRVEDGAVFDCDCSFLSGWGLAMWRSSRNVVSRNSFDFCVRGYSHGVYNRGQDSAGILMFEQCSGNIIAENSATHCGDGLFGFGGNASLQGTARSGNNDNLIIHNDFSYAAAHGIEMTFSFDNRIYGNHLAGNAICGIWAGYSQDTHIAGNQISDNGFAGQGPERGGINIEHGRKNRIEFNRFNGNACAVALWNDDDPGLRERPWVKTHDRGSTENTVANNMFSDEQVALELRRCGQTTIQNFITQNVITRVDADDTSREALNDLGMRPADSWNAPAYVAHGEAQVVGQRPEVRDRKYIQVTEWGPFDFSGFNVWPTSVHAAGSATVLALGATGTFEVESVEGRVTVEPSTGDLPGRIQVRAQVEPAASDAPGRFHPFSFTVRPQDGPVMPVSGSLLNTQWQVQFYTWQPAQDPRGPAERWQAIIAAPPVAERTLAVVDYNWGSGAPIPGMPSDHFATVASTTIEVLPGRYMLRTVSDDGIRVWLDDTLVVDDWTWHTPRHSDVSVELEAGVHRLRVEHFEIDGHAELRVRLEK